MHSLRRVLGLAVAAALASGSVGIMFLGAGAQVASAASCVTREQYLMDFDPVAGIAPTPSAAQVFSDVPASSPYFGDIEAAVSAGIISGYPDGTFHPLGCLTRAAIAKIEVLALDEYNDAWDTQSLPLHFKDHASIPQWAWMFVVEGLKLGLIHGFPDNTFRPNASMTPADERAFIAQYKKAEVKLAYGPPAAVVVSAAWTSPVLDGQSQDTMTFKVMDAKGNLVRDFSGTVAVSVSAGGGTWGSSGTETAQESFYDGVATDYVQSPGTYPTGDTAAVTESDLQDASGSAISSVTYTPLTLTYVAPVLSMVMLEASSGTVSSSVATQVTVTVQLLDQGGGIGADFSLPVELYIVQGPATFTATGTTKETLNVTGGQGTTEITTIPGKTGTIWIACGNVGVTDTSAYITVQ